MTKSLKKCLIASLVFVCALLLSLGMFITPSHATTDTTVAINSLQLRTLNDEKGEYGIRFIASVTNYDSGLTYGMDIVPEDLKGDTEKYAEVVATPTEDGGAYTYECALTDIHATNRSRPYTARPFVKDGSEKTYVGGWAEAKSIYTIATQALADQSYDKEGVEDYLETIVNTVHGVNSNLNGKYVYKTFTVNGEDVTSFAGAFTGDATFNLIVKMVKEGDESKVLTAYPIVEITDQNGQAINGVLTQVDAYGNYKLNTTALDGFNLGLSVGKSEVADVEDCTIDGYGVTYNQDGSITLAPATHVNVSSQKGAFWSHGWGSGVSATKNSYLSLGETKVGEFVDFYFEGNNMPQVVMFANVANACMGAASTSTSNSAGPVDSYGYLISNGLFIATGSKMYGDNMFYAYGPERIHKNLDTFNYDFSNLTTVNGAYNGLDDDTNYKYSIGSQLLDGKVIIAIELYNADTNTLVCRSYYTTGKTETEIADVGNMIVAYAGIKGKNLTTTFKHGEFYTNSIELPIAQGATFNADGSVTLAAGRDTGISYGGAVQAGWSSGIGRFKNNYLAFNNLSKVGNYIDFFFTGDNMPQVTLFADKINGIICADLTPGGGEIEQNGYLIANGIYQAHATNPVMFGENTMYVYGPNRISKNLNEIDYVNSGIVCVNGGYSGLDASVNYKYTVGSQVLAEKVVIVLELYNADSSDLLYRAYYPTNKTKTETETLGANLIAYAGVKGVKGDEKSTTFKYGDVYTKTVTLPLASGATFNADGTVTLVAGSHDWVSSGSSFGAFESAGWSSGISIFENSYVAFENASQVGNYFDFYFTGNNMPQVTLFANEINDCMGASTLSTHSVVGAINNYGYLIANGLCANNATSLYGDGMMYVYGEKRISTSLNGIDYSKSKLITVSGEYTGLTDGTNYKYTVGSKLVSDKVVIEVLLYTIEDTTETLIYSATYATDKTETQINEVGSHVIAYAGVKGASITTTFKYSEVYTKNA